MPLYEYRCNDCEKVVEVLQKITAEPLEKCFYCGGSVEKLISSTSFQFKGNGWYVTDYKNIGSNDSKKERSNEDSSPIKSTGTNKNATINK